MNFMLSDEQQMIKDSIARFITDDYDFDARNHAVANENGFAEANWQRFAELGWLAIPVPESLGGFGGSATDLAVIMEMFGHGLVAEPYVASVILFGGLLAHSDTDEAKALISDLSAGKVQGAFAYHERQSHFSLTDVTTRAVEQAGGYCINGEKTVVLNGAAADKLIVSCRTAGEQCDPQGISLFVVDADTAGVTKTVFRLMDGQVTANIRFDNVQVEASQCIGRLHEGYEPIKQVVNTAMLALCAEAVGIMHKLVDTTVEYSKVRKQFGVHIGSFQALQHRMVDMFIAAEQTRSLLFRAICSCEANDANFEQDVLALKIMVGRAGKLIGGEAVQLHGGMGMTEELAVGHYMRRLMMINTTFGDADYHQQRFADLRLA